MKTTLQSGLALLCLAFAAVVGAQPSPAKPIRMLVGFAPGGANDLLARIVGQRMSESLGQAVVVDNRTGAAGIIASEIVAKAASDGHTLLLGSIGAQVFVPLLRAKMPYDPVQDLLPVSLVGVAGTVLVVRTSLPVQSVRELVAFAKEHPGKLTFGSGGNGNSLHIAAELFKYTAGVNMLHVPYKGNAPALAAVVGGEVDLLFSAPPPALPLVKAGKLRMLGVSTTRRLTGLENVPTIAESGVPGYEMSSWYGVFASGGTPAKTAAHLAAEVKKALEIPQVHEQILVQGIEPQASTPAEFRKFVNDELAKWGKVIRAANIQAE